MKPKITLFISTVSHFVVDLSCIFFVTGILIPMSTSHEEWLAWAVFYNFMAFALPALLGFLADRFLPKENLYLASIGAWLVACGYLCCRYPVPSIFLAGLGNGLFHIGAGKEVLKDGGRKYAPSGIFISSGAMGVFLGSTWGRRFLPLSPVFFAALISVGIVLMGWQIYIRVRSDSPENKGSDSLGNKGSDSPGNSGSASPEDKEAVSETLLPERRSSAPTKRALYLCTLALFFVVFVRSYYGGIQGFSWKTGFPIGLVFTLCIVGGKFTGGILADLAGIYKAVAFSLSLAAVTALLAFRSPVCGCISIFFFNMTMPLTLFLLVDLMPALPGFAFGLLMLALFVGTLPTMLKGITWFFSPGGLCFLCLLSLFILLLELKLEKRPKA